MGTTPNFLGSPRTELAQFVPGMSTRPRVVWEAAAAGSEIQHINIASSDAGAQTVQLSIGKILTLASNMGTGALVDNGASADNVTRTENSFLGDGWRVGDRLFVMDPTTLANGFADILTAAAATSLSLATGGGTVDTAENLPTTAKLIRIGHSWSVAVAANSGLSANAAVSALDPAKLPGLTSGRERRLQLGPNTVLLAALSAGLSTGETVDVTCLGADF